MAPTSEWFFVPGLSIICLQYDVVIRCKKLNAYQKNNLDLSNNASCFQQGNVKHTHMNPNLVDIIISACTFATFFNAPFHD
jgi:hypothetical protein